MQTKEQINEYYRKRYLLPGMKEKASIENRLQYLKRNADKAECQPDYGVAFKSVEVQKILTNWGK